ADFELVMSLDEDPEVVAPSPQQEDAAPAAQAPAAAAPAAPAPAAVAAAGAPAMDDAPMTAGEGLLALLALQGKVRVEQIHMDETIDDVFDGVSSRRNQVLMDLGAEFNMGSIDAAHEMPLSKLVSELERRAPNYSGAGKILKAAQDAALQRVFARAGVRRSDVVGMLESSWGMPAKRADAALVTLALQARDGASGRGGALGDFADAQAGSREDAAKLVDDLAKSYGEHFGVAVAKRGGGQAAGGGVVDAAQVHALRDEILGEEGVVMGIARAVLDNLGHTLTQDQEPDDAPSAHEASAQAFGAELDEEWIDWTSPRFKEGFHVEFAQPWAPARRDLTKLYAQAMQDGGDVAARFVDVVHHLAAFTSDVVFTKTAGWYRGLAERAGRHDVAGLFESFLTASVRPHPVPPARPSLREDDHGQLVYAEAPDPRGTTLAHYIQSMDDAQRPVHVFTQGSPEESAWRAVLQRGGAAPLPFASETAVVTGASPGSIAVESVKHLLRGGATVVVTTTSYHARRMAFYKSLYRECGVPGSTLHVVPLNQGSIQDIDAFAQWLFREVTEQVGAKTLVLKRPMAPTLLLPFGAVRDLGTLRDMGAYSEFALRAMLTGVERLIAQIAAHYDEMGRPSNPCHVILPLSPNHGIFGGDGAYAESKAGLEVLLNRWSSERHAWGQSVTLCGARIGWVRGTGLMDANNPIAAKLEERTQVRTFSAPEMGFMIAALCAPEMKELAHHAPTFADLTGGFGDDPAVHDALGAIRVELEEHARTTRAARSLQQSWRKAVFGDDPESPTLKAMPTQPIAVPDGAQPLEWAQLPKTKEMLERTVVLVAGAEIGPWGSSRTRHVWEVDAELSAAAVLELAWITGLVRWERGGWVDVESGEEVEEGDIAQRYRAQLTEHSGIRFIEPEAASYDPQNIPVLTEVFLEQDMTFTVVTEEDARAFKAADPEHTTVIPDGQGAFKVTRKAGSIVRVPRTYRLDRQVAGLVPSGFNPALLGLPADLKENVDRITAYNLVATADAFISSGMTPDELLAKVHPARVANTQGSGIGGMQSLRRLYFDPLLGNERQPDILQETLINVVAAYVVQSYIGSYGAMVHPVGACATAAVSLEEAYDKILMDRADVVIAGAYDDIGAEGAMGFRDMNATAASDTLEAMGLEPRQFSRPNDVRRRGFVESQGGGTFVVARAARAHQVGVTQYGVVRLGGGIGAGLH
ncbi:MAG: beta-ketoacyl synthase N-terminal-like domain-containing protein, partial [Myxococcota bacterium]